MAVKPLYLHGVLKQADHIVEHLIIRLRHGGQIRCADTPVTWGAMHCRGDLGVGGNAVDLARTLPHVNHRVTKDHAIRHQGLGGGRVGGDGHADNVDLGKLEGGKAGCGGHWLASFVGVGGK